MLIIQTDWFTRADIQANPDKLYAWGDNLARYGGANNPKSGQAFACRGEPNSVGIPTKRRPSMDDSAFLTDTDLNGPVRDEIDAAFARLRKHLADGHDVVWPADGVGSGRAQLKQRAPQIWDYIEYHFATLKKEASKVAYLRKA